MPKYTEFRVTKSKYCNTQVCNRCKRVVSKHGSKRYDAKSHQVCSYLIMQKDCCQFSPMNNLLTTRGCDKNTRQHIIRGINLDSKCNSRRKREVQDTSYDDFVLDELKSEIWPDGGSPNFYYNRTSCQLVEIETCAPTQNSRTLTDGEILGMFGGIIALILVGLMFVYRWCQYDRKQLKELQRTRLQSRVPSPSGSVCVSPSNSQGSAV